MVTQCSKWDQRQFKGEFSYDLGVWNIFPDINYISVHFAHEKNTLKCAKLCFPSHKYTQVAVETKGRSPCI